MKVLYIAYSASPKSGSEEKIGWNIPLESSKTNEVILITKEEQRAKIEEYLSENDVRNIRVFYVDIPSVYKKIFKGALYSGRLNIWQKRALELAKKICKSEEIEVIHQITPVEFRSIGDYGSIDGVKFVCGPVGGGESIPKGLKYYAKGARLQEIIRNVMNGYSLLAYKTKGTLDRCNSLLFANRETQEFMKSLNKGEIFQGKCVSEIAIGESELHFERKRLEEKNKKRVFLVAGRLAYRKGHSLLLDALGTLPSELEYECNIVGSGSQFKKLEKKCKKLGLSDKVIFHGNLPFEKMNDIYDSSDILIMPSIRETTGSVLLEAASRGLCVIAMKRFGAAVLFDKDSAFLYDGKSREEYIQNLKKAVVACIEDEKLVSQKSEKAFKVAQSHTWEAQIQIYNTIYKKLSIKFVREDI